ncbi:MAG: transposase, partial [Dehalococcoidia bacterium]|nr:transposase [Dehalococcoidia bacterium]
PFLPELVGVLERHSELSLAGDVRDQLCRMSAATIDRVLKPYRRRGLRRPFSTTKPGSLLKAAIPIRTFADWDDKRPGFLEVDLVAHCGE